MASVGRPPIKNAPKVAVRHLDTGAAVAWVDGAFGGDKDLVRISRLIFEAGEPVAVGPNLREVTPDIDGATAAMLAACTGRGEIVTDFTFPNSDDDGDVQPDDTRKPVAE